MFHAGKVIKLPLDQVCKRAMQPAAIVRAPTDPHRYQDRL